MAVDAAREQQLGERLTGADRLYVEPLGRREAHIGVVEGLIDPAQTPVHVERGDAVLVAQHPLDAQPAGEVVIGEPDGSALEVLRPLDRALGVDPDRGVR